MDASDFGLFDSSHHLHPFRACHQSDFRAGGLRGSDLDERRAAVPLLPDSDPMIV